jgi:hypothetical protein
MLTKENVKQKNIKLRSQCGILRAPECQFGFHMCIDNYISYPIQCLPTGKDSTDDHETLTTGNGHQVRMPSVSPLADETKAFVFVSMLTCPLTHT